MAAMGSDIRVSDATGPVNQAQLAERPFSLTFGKKMKQMPGTWTDRRTLRWSELGVILTKHKEGPKDGPCIVPAILMQPERKAEHAGEIGLLFLDSDCGHTLSENEAAIKKHGLAAIVYSTHSHMTTRTTIARSEFKIRRLTAEQYLAQVKKYLPRVATGAWVMSEDEDNITIEHNPCPKYRVVLRLDRPWRALDYLNQDTANRAWAERYKAAAYHLGLTVDEGCSDPNRLFFLPRHEPGAPFETRTTEGADLRIWDLPAAPQENPPAIEPRKPAARAESSNGDGSNVIDAFNREFTVESQLEKHGYKKSGHKWIAPNSSTKMPGVSVKDGRAFSHHSSDRLFTGDSKHSHDAFSVFRSWEHGGDLKEAVKAAARLLNIEPKRNQSGGNGHGADWGWPEGYYEQAPSNAQKIDSGPELNNRTPDKQCPEIPTGAEFPFDALSGLALKFAELFSSYTEPPLQFYYFSFLTCLGSVLADKVTLHSQIEPQPRLYTLLLGESADDRKSTAIDQTAKFFHSFSIEKILNVCHGLGSAEGLQARMDETKGLNGTARLILFFDEFKSFVSKCKIEGSVLLPCVTTLFESNRYESRTKNSNIQLNKAHLSLLAASTLQTFENVWTSQFTDIGFGNRLWIVTGSGERRFSIPRKIPESDLYQLKHELNEILSLFSERVEMIVDPDAFALYDKWYLELEPSVHAKRIDTYALRLMPLLAANEAKSHVDVETVHKATQLCDWQLQARKLHDPIDSDNAIAKMEEKIRRNLRDKGPLKEWQLKQVTQANRAGLFVFNNAVKNLRGAHEIGWDRNTKCYFGGVE